MSYNASGVLAHMLSDGETAWTVPQPCREEVIQRMTFAIKRWPLDSKRNINYRYEMDIFFKTLKVLKPKYQVKMLSYACKGHNSIAMMSNNSRVILHCTMMSLTFCCLVMTLPISLCYSSVVNKHQLLALSSYSLVNKPHVL